MMKSKPCPRWILLALSLSLGLLPTAGSAAEQPATGAAPSTGESEAPAAPAEAAADTSGASSAESTAAQEAPAGPTASTEGSSAAEEDEIRDEPDPQAWSLAPAAAVPVGQDTAREPSSVDWPFVGGLATWAVGAGVLVLFHYAFFRLNDVVRDDAMRSYRDGVPEGESSCDRARAGVASTAQGAASPEAVVELCDEADSMELMRNLTLPIGLVASVVGLVLMGTSDTVNPGSADTEDQTAWGVNWSVGPQGGAAALSVHFF